MIRVDSTTQGSRTTIRIAGKLQARHIPELDEQCAAAEARVVLDLSELQSADQDALRWLSDWVARGERIAGESPYIRLLLERAQGGQAR